MSTPQFTAILDLQYGSTGKGLIAGYLAERDKPDTIVTAWAANAGHTYIDDKGRKFIHTMVANGVVSPNLKRLMLGPGSVIDPINLLAEIKACRALGIKLGQPGGPQIYIHPYAAIITQAHRDKEAGPMTKIGSTKKGVGAAAIQRIERDPDNLNVASSSLAGTELDPYVCGVDDFNMLLYNARRVHLEGAQGFSLSMYHGFYPYTTSRDVGLWQLLADCGIPAARLDLRRMDVIGTLRTFPIRVANRYDADGKQIGYSGPDYRDQREIRWPELGIEPELTTVTKLPRRIFTFSMQQLDHAVRHCGCTELFLNFCNYLLNAEELEHAITAINVVAQKADPRRGPKVRYLGIGPRSLDVLDLEDMDVFRLPFESSRSFSSTLEWNDGTH